MGEPTWSQMASPVWLFRAKPTEYEFEQGICGLSFVEGSLRLCGYLAVFLGVPVVYCLQVGWHPWVACLGAPGLVVLTVLISTGIKFRLQRPTDAQRRGFELATCHWFAVVFWPLMLASAVLAGVVGLVWWVVSQFV